MSGEGGAIAEVIRVALAPRCTHCWRPTATEADWENADDDVSDPHLCWEEPSTCGWSFGIDPYDLAADALLASPALADLLAAERQRGREEVAARVEGTTGWVPDPDAGEPYIYASDLRRALVDVPAAAEGDACPGDHAGPCFEGRPELCRDILRDDRERGEGL